MSKSDRPVGYGNPPLHTRFKPGVSANPAGRPKRRPSALADIISEAMNAPVRFPDHGRVKIMTRKEAAIHMLIRRAVAGDVASAYQILKARSQALRNGEMSIGSLRVLNWLPDEGETADRKNFNFERSKPASIQK